jgi:hypothetical protein
MKRHVVFLLIAAVFLLCSGLIYLGHYFVFRDTHHIFIYLVGDLAFLPLEVFLVVLVIDRLLRRREKQALLSKLNMIVGAFFSEVGTQLLARLIDSSGHSAELRQRFGVTNQWTTLDFKRARVSADSVTGEFDPHLVDLDGLKEFLYQKRPFMLTLLENPNLLEHETFTDMLLAIFHLEEELEARQALDALPKSDLAHIAGDLERVFTHLVRGWLAYVEHLRSDYPFLYSLVLRTHPLQDHPTPIVA